MDSKIVVDMDLPPVAYNSLFNRQIRLMHTNSMFSTPGYFSLRQLALVIDLTAKLFSLI